MKAYKIISEIYGNSVAKRSGAPLINHINEGLVVLKNLGTSLYAQEAYMVHPITQNNEYFDKYHHRLYELNGRTVLYAMEYAKTANNWLCGMPRPKTPLSSIFEVNQMLVADKIQNRKDFEIYHKATHENSAALDQYFKDWLEVLCVPEEAYRYHVDLIKENA